MTRRPVMRFRDLAAQGAELWGGRARLAPCALSSVLTTATRSDGLCDALALAGSHEAQILVIGRLWRSPSTATDSVLAAIGKLHPDKAVAKAARKAEFQRRSWLANR